MKRVKITVLRKEFYPEYADAYLTEGREVGPCPMLEVGDEFVFEGGAQMPEGFLPLGLGGHLQQCQRPGRRRELRPLEQPGGPDHRVLHRRHPPGGV